MAEEGGDDLRSSMRSNLQIDEGLEALRRLQSYKEEEIQRREVLNDALYNTTAFKNLQLKFAWSIVSRKRVYESPFAKETLEKPGRRKDLEQVGMTRQERLIQLEALQHELDNLRAMQVEQQTTHSSRKRSDSVAFALPSKPLVHPARRRNRSMADLQPQASRKELQVTKQSGFEEALDLKSESQKGTPPRELQAMHFVEIEDTMVHDFVMQFKAAALSDESKQHMLRKLGFDDPEDLLHNLLLKPSHPPVARTPRAETKPRKSIRVSVLRILSSEDSNELALVSEEAARGDKATRTYELKTIGAYTWRLILTRMEWYDIFIETTTSPADAGSGTPLRSKDGSIMLGSSLLMEPKSATRVEILMGATAPVFRNRRPKKEKKRICKPGRIPQIHVIEAFPDVVVATLDTGLQEGQVKLGKLTKETIEKTTKYFGFTTQKPSVPAAEPPHRPSPLKTGRTAQSAAPVAKAIPSSRVTSESSAPNDTRPVYRAFLPRQKLWRRNVSPASFGEVGGEFDRPLGVSSRPLSSASQRLASPLEKHEGLTLDRQRPDPCRPQTSYGSTGPGPSYRGKWRSRDRPTSVGPEGPDPRMDRPTELVPISRPQLASTNKSMPSTFPPTASPPDKGASPSPAESGQSWNRQRQHAALRASVFLQRNVARPVDSRTVDSRATNDGEGYSSVSPNSPLSQQGRMMRADIGELVTESIPRAAGRASREDWLDPASPASFSSPETPSFQHRVVVGDIRSLKLPPWLEELKRQIVVTKSENASPLKKG